MKKFKYAFLLIPVLALSACGQTAITKEELKTVATTIQTNNSSEQWVAPTKMEVTQTSVFSYKDGVDDMTETITGVNGFDLETGYFYYQMSATDGTNTESMALYSFVDGNDCYAAIDDGEEKIYVKKTLSSHEAAIAAAINNLNTELFMDFITALQSNVNGLNELEAVLGYINQLEVNNDSDPSNDITNGYTNYNLTFTASSSNETSFNAKFELNASANEEVEGVTYSGSLSGVMEVTFVNGLLTHYLDNATINETMTYDGVSTSMEVVSNATIDINYNPTQIKPDLTGYTEMQAN